MYRFSSKNAERFKENYEQTRKFDIVDEIFIMFTIISNVSGKIGFTNS